MKIVWAISGLMTIVVLAGAISFPNGDPSSVREYQLRKPQQSSSFEDAWDKFLRTDGAAITKQIEQIKLQVTKIDKLVSELNSRTNEIVSESPEFSKVKSRLQQLKNEQRVLIEKRKRMFLRWKIDESGVMEQEHANEDMRGAHVNVEIIQAPQKLAWPTIKELEKIHKTVEALKQKEQGLLIQGFGRELDESQMARFSFVYRYFENAKVPRQSVMSATKCYSQYILSGTYFGVDPSKSEFVQAAGVSTPQTSQLRQFHISMEKELDNWKDDFRSEYGINTDRYTRIKITKVRLLLEKNNLSKEDSRKIITQLKSFFRNGEIPHLKIK